MTFTQWHWYSKLCLDIVVTYQHTISEVSISICSKVMWKQTDRHLLNLYPPALAGVHTLTQALTHPCIRSQWWPRNRTKEHIRTWMKLDKKNWVVSGVSLLSFMGKEIENVLNVLLNVHFSNKEKIWQGSWGSFDVRRRGNKTAASYFEIPR